MLTTDTIPIWSSPLVARRLRVPMRGPDGGSCALGWVRRDTAASLEAWRLGELADDACLIVDELVGNVLRHAPGTEWASVALILDIETVRIEVSDGNRELPVLRGTESWDEEEGRGLQLVAGLAAAWGARPTPAGKTVWAELAIPDPPIYKAVRKRIDAIKAIRPQAADRGGV
jgi:Histidine kinase-like ATPase domain